MRETTGPVEWGRWRVQLRHFANLSLCCLYAYGIGIDCDIECRRITPCFHRYCYLGGLGCLVDS